MHRQPENKDTFERLINWDKVQSASERMTAQLLQSEGFYFIDPIHPKGGKDGGADILGKQDDLDCIVACYFPDGQQNFNTIRKKFESDLKGLSKHKVGLFVFATNQEVLFSQRKKLEQMAPKDVKCEIYHQERIAALLNRPENYGLRLEFLGIPMTLEEQISFSRSKDLIILRLLKTFENVHSLPPHNSESKDRQEPAVVHVEEEYNFPVPLMPNLSRDLIKEYHTCSFCGYGFKLENSINLGPSNPYGLSPSIHSGVLSSVFPSKNSIYRIQCPQCKHIDSIHSTHYL